MIALVLRIIAMVLLGLSGIFVLRSAIDVLIAFFTRPKHYPELSDYPNTAVMICARNEERVIGNLLKSLNQQSYPADRRKVFVIAHNCTDRTAQIAEACGAEVFCYNDPSSRTKGAALHYGIARLMELYPDTYETLTVFDADNLVDPEFLKVTNAAIADGAHVVVGLRRSKNRKASLISELAGALFISLSYAHDFPHSVLNVPLMVAGTGFTFRMDALGPDGWNTDTITEDMEFSCQQILKGNRIMMTPEAVFYDEQPVNLEGVMKQQLRWGVGRTQCMRKYWLDVVRLIPKKPFYGIHALLDVLVNFFLCCSVIGFGLQIAACILDWDFLALILLLGSLLIGYVGTLPVSILVLVKEKMPLKENWKMVALMPLFYLIPIFFAMVSIFKRNAKWRTIEHADQTKVEEIREEASEHTETQEAKHGKEVR